MKCEKCSKKLPKSALKRLEKKKRATDQLNNVMVTLYYLGVFVKNFKTLKTPLKNLWDPLNAGIFFRLRWTWSTENPKNKNENIASKSQP